MNVLSTSFGRMSLKNTLVKHMEIHSYIVEHIIKNKVKHRSNIYTQFENKITVSNFARSLWLL